jgi:hypothetical protein
MSPGNIPVLQMLLDILLKFQRPDLVKLCLGTPTRPPTRLSSLSLGAIDSFAATTTDVADEWIQLYPFAQMIAASYSKLASDMEIAAEPPSPSSSSLSSSSSSSSLCTTPSAPSSMAPLPAASSVSHAMPAVREQDRWPPQQDMLEIQTGHDRRQQAMMQFSPSSAPMVIDAPSPDDLNSYGTLRPDYHHNYGPAASAVHHMAEEQLLDYTLMPTVAIPSMPMMVKPTPLEAEAERWLMQAEQDATAYAARSLPHSRSQQQPSHRAAEGSMLGLDNSRPMPLNMRGGNSQPTGLDAEVYGLSLPSTLDTPIATFDCWNVGAVHADQQHQGQPSHQL